MRKKKEEVVLTDNDEKYQISDWLLKSVDGKRNSCPFNHQCLLPDSEGISCNPCAEIFPVIKLYTKFEPVCPCRIFPLYYVIYRAKELLEDNS